MYHNRKITSCVTIPPGGQLSDLPKCAQCGVIFSTKIKYNNHIKKCGPDIAKLNALTDAAEQIQKEIDRINAMPVPAAK
jgi:hypothetical protein